MQKTVLITGASSGLGKAFAKALLKKGYIVYGAARHASEMEEIKKLGAGVLEMDISKDEDIRAVVSVIEKERGGVDILINNAGFGLYGAIEDVPLEEARYQFEVNLFGLARLTQLCLPAMRRKKSGKVINISSMAGKIYTPMGGWYHASKHALEGLSDCLRLELSPFNIDVVVIEPGIIYTNFAEVMTGPLLKNSGDGPYSKMARLVAKATERSYKKENASDPRVIIELVLKAVKAEKPKTRYSAGKYAKLMPFIRKWFGDRIYDKAVMSRVER